MTSTFFRFKYHDFCCTLLQLFVWCTLSGTVTHFQRLSGWNIYGPEAAARIADLFTSSKRGLPLLCNVLRLCAGTKPIIVLEANSLRRYATFLCTPRAVVCLLLELVLRKERYRTLLRFIGQHKALFHYLTGLSAPRLFPGRRTANAAWNKMAPAMDMGPPRYAKGSISQWASVIYWKFSSWL